jgi:uncharacterized protein (TIGR02217 family)
MPLIQAFHDVSFPQRLALGASGGPVRRTEIVSLASGHEQRNARWALSRRRYDAGLALRSLADLQLLVAFFEARCGRLHAFRFRDPLDHRSSAPGQSVAPNDQALGVGDGLRTSFALIKNGYGALPRAITKPVHGSVRVAVGGSQVTAGVAFTIDHLVGIVEFLPGHVPPAGAVVTAGYEFDIPARFDTDEIRVNLAAFEAGDIPSVPLIEVLA